MDGLSSLINTCVVNKVTKLCKCISENSSHEFNVLYAFIDDGYNITFANVELYLVMNQLTVKKNFYPSQTQVGKIPGVHQK